MNQILLGSVFLFFFSSWHSIIGRVGKTSTTGDRHMITLCLCRPGNFAAYNIESLKMQEQLLRNPIKTRVM